MLIKALPLNVYQTQQESALLLFHVQLMNQYEAERTGKLEQKVHLSGELEAYQQETDDVQQWMKLIQEYAKLEELDRPTLLRLIKQIDSGERKVEDGREVRAIKHKNAPGSSLGIHTSQYHLAG